MTPEQRKHLEWIGAYGDALLGCAFEADVVVTAALAEIDSLTARLLRDSTLLVECIKTRGELGTRMLAAEARVKELEVERECDMRDLAHENCRNAEAQLLRQAEVEREAREGLEAKLAAVKALHRPKITGLCIDCGHDFPCSTFEAAESK